MQLGVGNLLVLVKVRDRCIQLAGLRICLLRHLLRLTGLSACLLRLLVCSIRRALRLVDPGLSATVDILNIVCVLCSELIKLIQPIFYWCYLTIYPLLASQGVHFSPKTLSGLGRKRLSSGVSRGICCCARSARGGRASRGWSGADLRSAAVRRRGSLRHRWYA
jgi:hypothetical protein